MLDVLVGHIIVRDYELLPVCKGGLNVLWRGALHS